MEWHVDDILFTKPQIELVLTIENSSDCQTMWEDKQKLQQHGYLGNDLSTSSNPPMSVVQAVQTEPNSVILIQAGGARHKVSALKNGRRVILKFVFVDNSHDNTLVDDAAQQLYQFSKKTANNGKGNKNKQKRKKR